LTKEIELNESLNQLYKKNMVFYREKLNKNAEILKKIDETEKIISKTSEELKKKMKRLKIL